MSKCRYRWICFDHIRKCGGTTIREQMKKEFGWLTVYGVVTKQPADPRPIKFIAGHELFTNLFSYGKRPDSHFFFTILRNPVDVVYSSAGDAFRTANKRYATPLTEDEYVNQHVDRFLDNPDSLSWMWRTDLHWEAINLDRYDLVMVLEELPCSLELLNKELGTSLSPHVRNNVTSHGNEYRRRELVERLQPHINTWRTAMARVSVNRVAAK